MLSRRLLRIKVLKALYAHFKNGEQSEQTTLKELHASIDGTYNLYLQLLRMPVEIRDAAAERIELKRKKKLPTPEDLNPNMRFVQNAAIDQIARSEELVAMLKTRKLAWEPETVKLLHKALVESDYFKRYMSAAANDFRRDAALLTDFYEHTAQDNEVLEDEVEAQSVLWADDLDFSLSMAVRTIIAMKPEGKLPLAEQFLNDEDARFAPALLRAALRHYEKSMELVARFATGGEAGSVAFMDGLVMAAAMAEMQAFDTIPVKVTLDEWIEIVKHFSTPGSGTFVNGVLDKAVTELGVKK